MEPEPRLEMRRRAGLVLRVHLTSVESMSNTTAADPAVSPRRSHTAPRTDATAAKSDRTASGPSSAACDTASSPTPPPEQHRLGPQMLVSLHASPPPASINNA